MATHTHTDDAYSWQLGSTVTLNGAGSVTLEEVGDWVALQFDGISIAQGTTITSATLRINCTSGDEGEHTIRGDDSDDAAALTATASDISGRTVTSALTFTGHVIATGYHDYAVTSIVQEIVNRAGWTSGNRMVLMYEGSGSDRETAAWNPSAVDTKLTITVPDATFSPATAIRAAQINGAVVCPWHRPL